MTLHALNNDNTKFVLRAVMARRPESEFFLGHGGSWWQSESRGHDKTGTQASFYFDRATARSIAAAYGIQMHERTRLDENVRYTWTIPSKATTRVADPILITLRVENTGKNVVGFVIGGRQRGARDNRFSFAVTRDGASVAIKEAFDFGGMMHTERLGPGDHVEAQCDLRSWANLDVAGRYDIEASHDGEIELPTAPEDQANTWDSRATGRGTIIVQ